MTFLEGMLVNLKKTDLKSKFAAVTKNVKKKGAAMKKRKNVSFHGFSKEKGASAAPRREGKLVVPIGVQTVMAVVVCCAVFLVAGMGFLGAQQIEIQNLKNELKAYVADGLVPAGSMDASVTLNIEAVAGRVANLETKMAQATKGELTKEELLWIGTELNAVNAESQILNDILNDVDADKNVRKAYADTVQSPIVVLQESYSTLSIPGAAGENGENKGAAGNTGAFKSSGNMEKGIRWVVVIAVVVILLLAVFILRRKLSAMLLRHHKEEAKNAPKKRKPAEPAKTGAKTKSGKGQGNAGQTHEHPFADDQKVKAEAPAEEAAPVEKTEAAAELSEEEAFLAKVDALQKMAEAERKKAEEGRDMIAPSPEDLMVFDATVENQNEIVEDDDPFFSKE